MNENMLIKKPVQGINILMLIVLLQIMTKKSHTAADCNECMLFIFYIYIYSC